MKAQRYPFNELKKDIQDAGEKNFPCNELKEMFNNEPFYLTGDYIEGLLKYCFEKGKIKGDEVIAHDVLLTKLRKVIEDFKLIN